jgi:hypothetical protein
MGEGTNRVGVDNETNPDHLSERVEESRRRLDALVAQLDERRHVVTRLKGSVIENRVLLIAAGLLTVAVASGLVALGVKRHRKQQRLRPRVRRLFEAFGRMSDHPDRVASEAPNLLGKLLTAGASTVTTTLLKRGVEKLVRPAGE